MSRMGAGVLGQLRWHPVMPVVLLSWSRLLASGCCAAAGPPDRHRQPLLRLHRRLRQRVPGVDVMSSACRQYSVYMLVVRGVAIFSSHRI